MARACNAPPQPICIHYLAQINTMYPKQKMRKPIPQQRGLTLLESLIALLVSALGILGVIGVQLRTLSDTQTSVRREQAIRLIEDFSERLKVNPNAMANITSYVSDWTSKPSTASKNCAEVACSASELAAYDLAQWKSFVQSALPSGGASVFVPKGEAGSSNTANRRQLGIMIRWRENEKSKDNDYLASINAAADGGDVTCNKDGEESMYTCHLQYIPVSARCAPYKGSSTPRYFCPGA